MDVKKITIVEDEIDTAEMFAEMMRLAGHEVVKTHSGVHAIDIILSETPDLVLLDVMMPDLSGLDVLRFMRRDPRLENIPVVIISAKTLEEDVQAGLEAGATIYLKKPIGYADLKSAVDKAFHLSIKEPPN